MSRLTQSHVEDAALEWLAGPGRAALCGPDNSPDGSAPEREARYEVILTGRDDRPEAGKVAVEAVA